MTPPEKRDPFPSPEEALPTEDPKVVTFNKNLAELRSYGCPEDILARIVFMPSNNYMLMGYEMADGRIVGIYGIDNKKRMSFIGLGSNVYYYFGGPGVSKNDLDLFLDIHLKSSARVPSLPPPVPPVDAPPPPPPDEAGLVFARNLQILHDEGWPDEIVARICPTFNSRTGCAYETDDGFRIPITNDLGIGSLTFKIEIAFADLRKVSYIDYPLTEGKRGKNALEELLLREKNKEADFVIGFGAHHANPAFNGRIIPNFDETDGALLSCDYIWRNQRFPLTYDNIGFRISDVHGRSIPFARSAHPEAIDVELAKLGSVGFPIVSTRPSAPVVTGSTMELRLGDVFEEKKVAPIPLALSPERTDFVEIGLSPRINLISRLRRPPPFLKPFLSSAGISAGVVAAIAAVYLARVGFFEKPEKEEEKIVPVETAVAPPLPIKEVETAQKQYQCFVQAVVKDGKTRLKPSCNIPNSETGVPVFQFQSGDCEADEGSVSCKAGILVLKRTDMKAPFGKFKVAKSGEKTVLKPDPLDFHD